MKNEDHQIAKVTYIERVGLHALEVAGIHVAYRGTHHGPEDLEAQADGINAAFKAALDNHPDKARLDVVGRWLAKDTWADALQADGLNDMVLCGNDIRKAIDSLAGKEATWLPASESPAPSDTPGPT